MLPENEASILDRTAKAESLDELREALDVLRTWKYEGVDLRADQPTSLTFASNVATLTVDIRAHCGLAVTLRTGSKTATCAVEVQNIALRFAQIEHLVEALASDESEIYEEFLRKYEHERHFALAHT